MYNNIDANRHYFDQKARNTNKDAYMYTDQIQDMYNNIDDDYGPLMGVYMLLFFNKIQGTNKIK